MTKKFNKKALCLVLNKALYGYVQSALLWHKMFSTTIIKTGFKLNPFDLCVANKNINGNQCTIVCCVDISKTSHESEAIVKSIVAELEEHFGKISSVSYGLEHDFLGTKVKFEGK